MATTNIFHKGSRSRDGTVGQLLPEPLAVKLTRDNKPASGEWVDFETDPEGWGEFAPSGESYGSVETDKAGYARIQFRPMHEGQVSIRVTAFGQTQEVFTVNASRATAATPGSPVLDMRRGRTDWSRLAWPLVTALFLLLTAGFGGLVYLTDTMKTTQPAPPPQPVVIQQGGGGGATTDPVARTRADNAQQSFDAWKGTWDDRRESVRQEAVTNANGYTRRWGEAQQLQVSQIADLQAATIAAYCRRYPTDLRRCTHP